MTDKKPDVFGGMFFRRDHAGRLHPSGPETPAYTVCRRLRDFTNGMPEHGKVTACRSCGCAVVTAAVFPNTPHICLQCANIEPLPFEETS